MEIISKNPRGCFSFEITDFIDLLEKSGEVDLTDIRYRIEHAHTLVFARAGRRLVGISAIKKPDYGYLHYLSSQIYAQLPSLEFGWIYVEPDYRGNGLCKKLMEMAINNRFHLFATTRISNVYMMKLLSREFEPYGITYESTNGDYLLHAFLRKGSMWLRPIL
jgi:predicted GNAT family N-acyltransferase